MGQISYPRHGGHARLGTLGHSGEQVGHEVGAAALPAGSSKDCGDGVLQPLVSIGVTSSTPLSPRAVSDRPRDPLYRRRLQIFFERLEGSIICHLRENSSTRWA